MKWRNTKEREMMKSRHNQQKVEKNENGSDSSKTVEINKCILNPQLSVENLTATKHTKISKTNEFVQLQNGYPPTNISLNCCTNHMPFSSKVSCNSGLLNSSKSPNSSLYISTSSFNSLSSSPASSSLSPISVENNSNSVESESEEISPDAVPNNLNSDEDSSYDDDEEDLKIKHDDRKIKINCTDDESENDECEINDENNNRKPNGETKIINHNNELEIKLEKQ